MSPTRSNDVNLVVFELIFLSFLVFNFFCFFMRECMEDKLLPLSKKTKKKQNIDAGKT